MGTQANEYVTRKYDKLIHGNFSHMSKNLNNFEKYIFKILGINATGLAVTSFSSDLPCSVYRLENFTLVPQDCNGKSDRSVTLHKKLLQVQGTGYL